MENKDIDNLFINNYISQYKIDNIIVEIKYSDNNKTLRECIENILERKSN